MVFISRDVYFYEDIFPFKDDQITELQHSTYEPVLHNAKFTMAPTKKPSIQEATGDNTNTHGDFDLNGLTVDLNIQLISLIPLT